MSNRTLAVSLALLSLPCLLRAQAVFFDVSPPGTRPATVPPTVTTSQPVEVVLPGSLVPYELGVFVQLTPALPNINGLGAFDVNILTDLGRLQPPLTGFNAIVQQAFTVNLSPGTPTDDDILNITGIQDTAGITNAGIALGRRQIIGTGQFITPQTEGDFQITATGTAQVFNTATTLFQPTLQPADVGFTRGFIIQTRTTATQPTTPTTSSPAEEGLNAFGTTLLNLCFPQAAMVVPACTLGLVGMRYCFRRRRI